LGLDGVGVLAPGKEADLLLIRADLPTPLVAHNLADQLLLWRNPADLRGVLCAGRWLMYDGQVPGYDEADTRRRVVEAAQQLWGASPQSSGTGCAEGSKKHGPER